MYLQCGRRDTRKAVINLKPVMFPAQKRTATITSGKEDYGQMNSTQIYYHIMWRTPGMNNRVL